MLKQNTLGSGCGAVGRAVASDPSSATFIKQLYLLLTVCRKDEK